MSLPYIAQEITIYAGSFLLVIGIIGNGINILVFTSIRSYRKTPCTFYFLIASIFNIIYILVLLPSRLVISGSGVDLTRTSTSWCKLRQFFSSTLALPSLTCSCLATIDHFFATSQSVRLRRFSSIKWAPKIVLISTTIWCLHGIPILIYFDISPITKSCVNTNYTYAIYVPIYIFSLLCAIPVLVMAGFGYLTYRNIHHTRVLAQQQADRQVTRMVLVEVVLVVAAFVPYGINGAYTLITLYVIKDTNRMIIEGFTSTVSNLLSYIYFVGSCYIFLISSNRFRQATIGRIFFCLHTNQVAPSHVRLNGATR